VNKLSTTTTRTATPPSTTKAKEGKEEEEEEEEARREDDPIRTFLIAADLSCLLLNSFHFLLCTYIRLLGLPSLLPSLLP